MSVFHPWVLATVAACSVALVAGPVSAGTRRYVRDPLGHDDRGSGIDRPEDRERSEYSTPPRPGLLAIVPQSLLSLALCGFCAWWGMTADVMGAALVAVPVYALLTSAACVDAVAHLLPNRLLGATAAWLSACGVVAVVAHPGNAHAALRAALCALGAGATGLLLALAPSGLGLGDVKLCTVIGLWLGWYGVLPLTLGLCAGVALGGLAAIFLLITRRAGRKDPMAYGPHLIAGALMSWPLAAA